MEEAENAFSCKICYQSYDDDLKKPYILTPCSHTICLDCLKSILTLSSTCPFCIKEIKASLIDMKPNYELIDIIYKIKHTNNVARCTKCKELINIIYFIEKNSNVQFICKYCAKDGKSQEEAQVMSLHELIDNTESELNTLQNELNANINKENLKNVSANLMTDFLKKTLCDLLDQKKELLASFLESSDFISIVDKFKKTLENILKSKDSSLKYLQANSVLLKNTIKDLMIHNILNVKNLENDDILTQKIRNFNQNLQKEFNKNKLYLHGVLSTITNDIIYQANIALFNSLRECLRDDFYILDKLVEPSYTQNLQNLQNFQQNHIQGSFLYQQMQIKNKIKSLDLFTEDDPESIIPNHNSLITESFVASVIGLSIEYHPNMNKLKILLENTFNCRASIIEKDDGYYGAQLYFKTLDNLDHFMNKKYHTLKIDDKTIRLAKKQNKSGNRFYIKYS
jgi:hypothetical protein